MAEAVTTRSESSDDRRTCWVCYASQEDEPNARWVRPCLCRGSSKWVHTACLQRWIDEKQKGNTFLPVKCPQCNVEYVILYPRLNILMKLMRKVDILVDRLCPIVVVGSCLVSLYWSAFTYGAITVVQVMGSEKGVAVLEQADSALLLTCLPCIPVGLIIGKLIHWDRAVLQLLNRYVLPAVRVPGGREGWNPVPLGVAPAAGDAQGVAPAGPEGQQDPAAAAQQGQPIEIIIHASSGIRVVASALAFPTIATLMGRALFSHVENPIFRALLGGTTFVGLKGAAKIYYQRQQMVRQAQRTIKNFPDGADVSTQTDRGREVCVGPPSSSGDADWLPEDEQDEDGLLLADEDDDDSASSFIDQSVEPHEDEAISLDASTSCNQPIL